MEKRAIILLAFIILLTTSLWGGNQLIEVQKVSAAKEVEREAWGEILPTFRNEEVSELYVIQPKERKLVRVIEGTEAQILLNMLSDNPIIYTPTQDTELGFLVKVDENYFSYYLKESGSNIAKVLVQAEQALAKGKEYVDIYSLIFPSQITSIHFEEYNPDATIGNISLITSDPSEIEKIMALLRAVQVEALEVSKKTTNSSQTEQKDGYYVVINLGAVYNNQQIEIDGTRYGFTVDFAAQSQQRFYTVSYLETKQLMEGLRALPSARITPENTAGDDSVSDDTETSFSTELPIEDYIPLPEEFFVMSELE